MYLKQMPSAKRRPFCVQASMCSVKLFGMGPEPTWESQGGLYT